MDKNNDCGIFPTLLIILFLINVLGNTIYREQDKAHWILQFNKETRQLITLIASKIRTAKISNCPEMD